MQNGLGCQLSSPFRMHPFHTHQILTKALYCHTVTCSKCQCCGRTALHRCLLEQILTVTSKKRVLLVLLKRKICRRCICTVTARASRACSICMSSSCCAAMSRRQRPRMCYWYINIFYPSLKSKSRPMMSTYPLVPTCTCTLS